MEYDNHRTSAATRDVTKAVEKAEFDWATWETANLEKTREITDGFFTKVPELSKPVDDMNVDEPDEYIQEIRLAREAIVKGYY